MTTRLANVELVTDGLRFPEGPVALPDGDILVVELQRGTLTRIRPDGSSSVVTKLGGGPNGAAIGPDGRAYVAQSGGFEFNEPSPGLLVPDLQPVDYLGGRIQAVDLTTGEVEDLYTECNGNPLRGPNDLVFDSHGGFWFTDNGKARARDADYGGIYYAQADGSAIREAIYPVSMANGIGLSPDGATLYYTETRTARVFRFPIPAPGVVDAGAVTSFVQTDRSVLLATLTDMSFLDSLAVDSAGHVCVGTLGHHPGITEFDPSDGSHRLHTLPPGLSDPLTTNICFGGPELATAYITCSGYGRLIKCDWERPGAPLNYLNA